MSAQHTPGPWQWFERTPGRTYIATPDRGQLYVLGFKRKGMQGASPVFAHWPGIEGGAARERKGGIMEDGLLLRDGSIHPDARLIAAAPDLLAALRGLHDDTADYIRLNNLCGYDNHWMVAARAAIAKATGETP
jgi:hypothetical protein